MFDSVVDTNSEELKIQMFKWTCMLRKAVETNLLEDCLEDFETELLSKKFTRPEDHVLAKRVMRSLVRQFVDNWEQERLRQLNMQKRNFEMNHRWGTFTESYTTSHGLDRINSEIDCNDRVRCCVQIVTTCMVGPAVALISMYFNHIINAGLASASLALMEVGMSRVFVEIPFSFPSTPLFLILFASFGSVVSFLFGDNTPFVLAIVIVSSVVLMAVLMGMNIVPAKRYGVLQEKRPFGVWLRYPVNSWNDLDMHTNTVRADFAKLTLGILLALAFPILTSIALTFPSHHASLLVLFAFLLIRIYYQKRIEVHVGAEMGSDIIPSLEFIFIYAYTVALSIMLAFSRMWAFSTLCSCLLCAPTFLLVIRLYNMKDFNKVSPQHESYEDEDSTVFEPTLEAELAMNRRTRLMRTESVSAMGAIEEIERRGSRGDKRSLKCVTFLITLVIFDHIVRLLASLHSCIVLSILSRLFGNHDDEQMQYKSLLISSDDSTWQISTCNALVHLFLLSIMLFYLNLKFGQQLHSRALIVGMMHSYLKAIMLFSFISWLLILCFCHASSGTDWTFKFDWIECDVAGKNQTGVFEWDGCS